MIRISSTICTAVVVLAVSGCAPGTMESRQRSLSAPLERQVEAQQLRISAMEQQLATLSKNQREQGERYAALMERLDAVLQEVAEVRKGASQSSDRSGDNLVMRQPYGVDANGSTEQKGTQKQRTPTQVYREAFAAYTTGKHARAQELFEEFATSFPDNEYVANARFWQGEACLAQGLYEEAEQAFAAVEEFDPRSAKVPFARLKRGLIKARQGDTDAARDMLEDVRRNYPDTEAAQQAKAVLDSGRLD